MKKIKVIIVDDHPVVIDGLRFLLKEEQDIELMATFNEGLPFIAFIENNKPDVVLLDITLPDISGIELCSKIKSLDKKIKVLGLSNHDEHSIIAQMLRKGANGYLLKNASASELLEAIKEVYVKDVYFSSKVQQVLLQSYNDKDSNLPMLTRRENEILILISDGKTTNEIAETLFISPSTVETHRKNMIQKFEVNNVASLIKKATQLKII
jgi:DNA-binding NarL/FixJ family response regulator